MFIRNQSVAHSFLLFPLLASLRFCLCRLLFKKLNVSTRMEIEIRWTWKILIQGNNKIEKKKKEERKKIGYALRRQGTCTCSLKSFLISIFKFLHSYVSVCASYSIDKSLSKYSTRRMEISFLENKFDFLERFLCLLFFHLHFFSFFFMFYLICCHCL